MEVNVMTSEEIDLLAENEAIVRQGLAWFIKAAAALRTIRDKRLFRGKYTRWKDYTKGEWDISRTHADRLIHALEVVELLSKKGTNWCFDILPKNEAQARPLTLLSVDQIPEAWSEVLSRSNSKPTALVVSKVVTEALEAQISEEKAGLQQTIIKEITVPDDFSEQFTRLIEILDVHRKGGWKEFNRKKALEFIRAIEAYLNS